MTLTNPFLIGLPACAVCLFAGYLLREFAVGKLSAEQLGSLDKSLRPTRIRFIVSTVAVSLVFFAVRYSIPRLATTWFEIVLFVTAAMTVGCAIRRGMPASIPNLQRRLSGALDRRQRSDIFNSLVN